MIRKELKLSFVTPAFLGNAEQRAQWRTPPIKALLRERRIARFLGISPSGLHCGGNATSRCLEQEGAPSKWI